MLPKDASAGKERGDGAGGRGNVRLRSVDQAAGPALLFGLGLARRKRSLPPLRRIGLMKTAGIGDMVLLTAVASDTRARYPDADVVLIGGPQNTSIAELTPAVRTLAIPTTEPRTALELLRAEQFDALVDFGQWTRLEAVLSAMSGARWTVGFRTQGQRRHYAYDATVEHSSTVPELENFRRLIGQLGVESTALPSFVASDAEEKPVADLPYVVLHLWPGGYRSELREWPLERWRELAERLARDGFSIVLTGGTQDAARTDAFIGSLSATAPAVSVVGRRLPDLVGILERASCVISVNTGVMHMAAATGAPTVALNGPTSALRWGPIGQDVVCVDSDLSGCGFLNLGFEYDGQRLDCMEGISVERVLSAVSERARA